MSIRRTILVVTPENVEAVNQAVALATGNPADEQTFTVQLTNDRDEVVGYLCSWDFVGTGIDYDAIRKVIESAVGAPKDAAATVRVGATGTLATSKVLAYDGSRVTADAVAARAGAKLAAADPIAEMPAGEGEITGK